MGVLHTLKDVALDELVLLWPFTQTLLKFLERFLVNGGLTSRLIGTGCWLIGSMG
jgi:hypothetical protein